MHLHRYLSTILEPAEVKCVEEAIRSKRPVIVDGPCGPTGKTTLVEVLKKCGVPAVEAHEALRITLTRPLTNRVPRMEELISCGTLENVD